MLEDRAHAAGGCDLVRGAILAPGGIRPRSFFCRDQTESAEEGDFGRHRSSDGLN